MMYWGNGGVGGWLLMALGMLVFWAAIIAILVAGIRAATTGWGHANASDDNAIQILDERFARGDIDEEEYRSRRDTLRRR